MRKSVIKKIAKVVVCSVMALVLTVSGVNIPNMHTDENVIVAKAASVRKCFTICNWNTRVYSNSALTIGTGWIYPSDEVTVYTVTGRYCYVGYPTRRGTRKGYIATNAVLLSTGGSTYRNTGASFTTYRRIGGAKYGTSTKGDSVTILGTSGSYTQIKYNVASGYKYAFALTSDVDRCVKGIGQNNSSVSNAGSTYSISGNLLTVNGTQMSDYRIGGKYTNSNYAMVNGRKVYMAGSQCCGYARYIAYKLYGCHDKSAPGKFRDVSGYVAAGRLTADKLKSAVTAAGVGSHIRTNGRQHSMSIIGVTDSGFTITDANSDGKLTVRVATYTWSSYVNSTYGKRGLLYIKKYVG
jgi:hypothetical protein